MKVEKKIGITVASNDWPCKYCTHRRNKHEIRQCRSVNTMYDLTGGGKVVETYGPTYTETFCHAQEPIGILGDEFEACGCSCYEPVDNLQYLESKI